MVILTINFVLVFVGPAVVDGVWKIIIAYITYVLIGLTFDMNDIPKNAVFLVATPNLKERNSLSIYRTAGMLLGAAVIGVVAPALIEAGSTVMEGYMILVFSGAAMMLIFTFAGVTGIRERIEPVEEKRPKAKDVFRIYSRKPMLLMLLTSLAFTASINTMGGANVLYATEILGDLSYTSLSSILTLVGTIPGFIGFPLLANRIDKRKLMFIAIGISIFSAAIRILAPASVLLYYVGSALSSLALGGFITMSGLFSVDNNDYIEQQMHIRAEGISLRRYSHPLSLGIARFQYIQHRSLLSEHSPPPIPQALFIRRLLRALHLRAFAAVSAANRSTGFHESPLFCSNP